MNTAAVLVVAALAASIVLVMQIRARLFPVIALAASGIEGLLVFRVLRFSLGSINLMLVLGAALVVAGVAIWMKTSGKTPVTAATTVAIVGAVQVLGALL
jgi:hypothetical protein